MAGHPVRGALARLALPDETVVLEQRRHKASVAEPTVTAGLAALVMTVALLVAQRVSSHAPWVLWWLVLVPAGRAAWRWLEWRSTWFGVTDKRLVLVSGVVTRKVAMLPIGKVTDMSYARTPVGRVLGYGRFVMESAGQDQALRQLDWVARPDDTYRQICRTLFGSPAAAGRPAAATAAGPVPPPPRRGDPEAATGELPVVAPARAPSSAAPSSSVAPASYVPQAFDAPDAPAPLGLLRPGERPGGPADPSASSVSSVSSVSPPSPPSPLSPRSPRTTGARPGTVRPPSFAPRRRSRDDDGRGRG